MADTTWHVTDQASDQATINSGGQAITGVRVYFQTGKGNRGSVLIADDHYQPDEIAGAINDLATRMDTVSDLTDQDVAQAQ